MQIFPADAFGSASRLSSTSFGSAIKTASPYNTGPLDFKTAFKDVIDTLSACSAENIGVPLAERASQGGHSFFKGDDFRSLKEQLINSGVTEDTVNEYFKTLHTSSFNPTIADMRAAVNKVDAGRDSEPLDNVELARFRDLLGKFGFSEEEMAYAEASANNGDNLAVLKMIQQKIEAMTGESGHIEVSKEEFELLLRACDITGEDLETIQGYWRQSDMLTEDETIFLNHKEFGKIFGSHIQQLQEHADDLARLAENMDASIKAMLAAKKERTAKQASASGNEQTERAETMLKVLATLINEENPA